jgi:MFS family permease
MILGLVGLSLGGALMPLAPSGAILIGAGFLIGQQLIGDSAGTVYDIVETSLTQSIVDGRILGRVNASTEFFTTLLALAGAIGGGIIAEVFGLRAALAVGVIGGALAIPFIWFSPIRSIRGTPPPLVTHPVAPEEAPLSE